MSISQRKKSGFRLGKNTEQKRKALMKDTKKSPTGERGNEEATGMRPDQKLGGE